MKKYGGVFDSFGTNSQTVQKGTVPMPNPVNSKDTNIFMPSKLHQLFPDYKFPPIGIF
jgi:hypothetical protein